MSKIKYRHVFRTLSQVLNRIVGKYLAQVCVGLIVLIRSHQIAFYSCMNLVEKFGLFYQNIFANQQIRSISNLRTILSLRSIMSLRSSQSSDLGLFRAVGRSENPGVPVVIRWAKSAPSD